MEEKKIKQPVSKVLKNNWFIIKMVFTASPAYLIFPVLDAIRNQVSIFFEHTYGIGYVLEAAEFGYPFWEVGRFILILAGLITLGMVFTVFVGDFICEKERPKVQERIKMMLYDKAKDLDLECYDNPEYYNEMVLAISEVDNQIERVITGLKNLFAGLATFITTGIYFMMNDKISILFAVISFAMAMAFYLLTTKISYRIRVNRNKHERKRDYVKRVFYLSDYAKEIRLNPQVADVLEGQFVEANNEIVKVEKKYARKKFLLRFMAQHVSNNMFSDVLYITYLVFKAAVLKTLSYSRVVILYNSFGRMKHGLRVFTDVYPYMAETSLYVQKIRDFLAYDSKIVSEKGLTPGQDAKDIEFKDVCFAYRPEDGNRINNLSLHIKRGHKIALVGYNGAGKTTLVKLLMRLYDITSGEILADGVNIKDYDVEKYRESIGTVFQDYKIFAGNVRENVVMDHILDVEEVNREERERQVREALRESGLLERINAFEKGLDTELTTEIMEQGVNLSGGESQKLAISRVFYKQSGLMILDEPSSALDPIAEYELNHAMLSQTKDKSVIFISHRLSTTRLADYIVMLEHGQIVEAGSHEELLAMDGKYAQMWRVQAGAYIEV